MPWLASDTARSLLAGLVAAGAVLTLTPFVIRLSHARGWVAHPRTDRWHRREVALMGGVAITAGLTLSVALTSPGPWGIRVLGVAVVAFALGFIDDRRPIMPRGKLLVQTAIALALWSWDIRFVASAPAWVHLPLTVGWIVGITNSTNMLDNMDGLAAGVSAVTALGVGVFLLFTEASDAGPIAFALAGAAGAFLVFNFNGARVFMGDCGSLTLGVLLATLTLVAGGHIGRQYGSASGVAATLASATVLLMDTALVVVTRWRDGRPVMLGGRDHSSHRLVYAGLSETNAVLALYGVAALGVATPLVAVIAGRPALFAYAAVLAAGGGAGGWWLAGFAAPVKRPRAGGVESRRSGGGEDGTPPTSVLSA